MRRVSPYLKMRVLGAIDYAPGNTRIARIKHVADQIFKDEDGALVQFTWRTIQTWYSRYRKDGITSMHPRARKDKGTLRKVTPEAVHEAIQQALPAFHEAPPNVAAVYKVCIENGYLAPQDVAVTTFRRIVKQHKLLAPEDEHSSKRRLAFAKPHANDLWQADTMVGPFMKISGQKPTQARLIAFVDDASRVCCHGEFVLAENTDALLRAFRTALYKRGVPDALYVDNGSVYSSKEITQVCARLGTLLCHAPVRDGAAKGKVERFFRTVRMQFLSRALDLSSLTALNAAFTAWSENTYNTNVHRTLQMKPIDRFGLDLGRIRFLPPGDVSDELFFVEETRKVAKDNTFSLHTVRFEAPRDLRSRTIGVRYHRVPRPKNAAKNKHAPRPTRAIVYLNGQRMGEARPLDRVANDRPPSKNNDGARS
jgi:putative transposase